MDCPIQPPSWFNGGGSPVCGVGDLALCNMVFASSVAIAANASGTMTFDVSASNFRQFKPVGMQFTAVNLALSEFEMLGQMECTALNHAGTDYLLGGTMSLFAFGVDGQKALSVQHLPELTPGAQDITLSLNNNGPAMGTTLTTFGWLWGFGR